MESLVGTFPTARVELDPGGSPVSVDPKLFKKGALTSFVISAMVMGGVRSAMAPTNLTPTGFLFDLVKTSNMGSYVPGIKTSQPNRSVQI